MSSITKWVESVQTVLMFGLDDEACDDLPNHEGPNDGVDSISSGTNLQEIKSVLDDLLSQSHHFGDETDSLRCKLSLLSDKVHAATVVQDATSVMERLEKYIKLKLKIQHMCLVRAMYQLKHYKTVKNIPTLIFAARDDIPGALLGHSRIKRVVQQTVDEVKGPLLAQFHKILDDHLVAAQKEVPGSGGDASREDQQWVEFVGQARDSLLAFTMVNMLLTVLTETSGMVLEKFQDTLDEALTPTWGRYHYHLQVARKARSSEQIMWTFDYTRSFVRMMCDLSLALTSSSELQRLSSLNYASAGQKQVLDKASRFMRAHLAQIVVDFSPMSREMCMQLVEETLELDEWIHSVAAIANTKSASASDTVYTPLTVCEVLYDAKEVFHQWLHLEHRHFHFELRGRCRDARRVFAFEFGETTPASAAGVDLPSAASGDVLRMSRLRCYAGVYDTMCLFFSACERYRHLPGSAQRVFSVVILEPLLCTALGLLLYRTRSSSVLYQVSMGTYKREAVGLVASQSGRSRTVTPTTSGKGASPANPTTAPATGADSGSSELPRELVEFIDSALYLQACLGSSARRRLQSHSAAEFKSALWSELQSWMPQILISEEDAKKGFSTVDLVDKAWKLPPEYATEREYGYRNPPSRNASGKGRAGGTTSAREGPKVGEIGECVDVARGLAITLCNVLKQQLSVCR